MNKKASNITYRWMEAPKPTLSIPYASTVLGVNLAPGEDVEWLWTHTDRGSYVNGYIIIDKQQLNISMGNKLEEITNG